MKLIFFALKDEINWNPEIIEFDAIKDTAFCVVFSRKKM